MKMRLRKDEVLRYKLASGFCYLRLFLEPHDATGIALPPECVTLFHRDISLRQVIGEEAGCCWMMVLVVGVC